MRSKPSLIFVLIALMLPASKLFGAASYQKIGIVTGEFADKPHSLELLFDEGAGAAKIMTLKDLLKDLPYPQARVNHIMTTLLSAPDDDKFDRYASKLARLSQSPTTAETIQLSLALFEELTTFILGLVEIEENSSDIKVPLQLVFLVLTNNLKLCEALSHWDAWTPHRNASQAEKNWYEFNEIGIYKISGLARATIKLRNKFIHIGKESWENANAYGVTPAPSPLATGAAASAH